jgi:hypothetical protein
MTTKEKIGFFKFGQYCSSFSETKSSLSSNENDATVPVFLKAKKGEND